MIRFNENKHYYGRPCTRDVDHIDNGKSVRYLSNHHCAACENSKGRTDYHRNMLLVQKYGITIEEYKSMLIKQDHRCAICNVHMDDNHARTKAEALTVDHDHSSGKVRGLLCKACNLGIGNLNTIEKLKSAILYLQEQANMPIINRMEKCNE